MKNLVIIFLFLFLNSFNALAAKLAIEWVRPENYTDLLPGTENKKTYQKEVLGELERYIKKLSQKLPEQQTLYLQIKNIDLAGTITFANSHKIRIIDKKNPPHIIFSYKLIDNKTNKVIKSGDNHLWSKNFNFTRPLRVDRPLVNEKALLKSWFKETLNI